MFNVPNNDLRNTPSHVPPSQPQRPAHPHPLNNEGLNALNFPIFPAQGTYQPLDGSRFIAHSNQQFQPIFNPPLPQAQKVSSYEVPSVEYLEQLLSNANHSANPVENLQQVQQYVSGLKKELELEIDQIREARQQLSLSHFPVAAHIQPRVQWPNPIAGDESDDMLSFYQGNQTPHHGDQTLLTNNTPPSQFLFDPTSASDEPVPELEAALKELYDKEKQLQPTENSGVLNSKKRSAAEAFAYPPRRSEKQLLGHHENSTKTNRLSIDPQREDPRPPKRMDRGASHGDSTQSPKIRTGDWTHNETEYLRNCIIRFGPNWEFISQNCFKGARTAIQCEFCFEIKLRPSFTENHESLTPEPFNEKSEIEPKKYRTPRVGELRPPAKITSKMKMTEWTKEEIEILKRGIKLYGKQWEIIAELCFNGTRNATQCECCFALNIEADFSKYKEIPQEKDFPLKAENRSKVRMTDWEAQEIEKLIRGIETYGEKWEIISQRCFNGERTAIQCESYFLFLSERNSETYKKYVGNL